MFYQWNRATGWSTTDPAYTIDATGTRNDSPTWDTSNDTGTTWESANNVCPAGWRVPTTEEQRSLFNTRDEWVTSPVNGRIFGNGENTLFLPAAGHRLSSDASLANLGSYGFYWSSTYYGSDTGTDVYRMYFRSTNQLANDRANKSYGFSVRCVAVYPVTGISLNTTTLTLAIGEDYTLTATVLPDNANKTVTWETSDVAIATVANGKVTAIAAGTATITATAGGETTTCAINVKDGIRIDGIIWAKTNVAAPGHFADSPEDPGMFYQWNRAIGWSATDPLVASDGEATWDSSNATGDTWETTNNVCPAGWRVPTNAELTALANAGSEWVTTPANGRVFGSGENTLFLPAAGYRIGSSSALSSAGTFGHYWSSTPNNDTSSYDLRFGDGTTVNPSYNNGREYGFSVRCVAE
jgi:uncharacterized protein (TIGR02145 family)